MRNFTSAIRFGLTFPLAMQSAMLPTQSSFLIPQRFLHVPFLC